MCKNICFHLGNRRNKQRSENNAILKKKILTKRLNYPVHQTALLNIRNLESCTDPGAREAHQVDRLGHRSNLREKTMLNCVKNFKLYRNYLKKLKLLKKITHHRKLDRHHKVAARMYLRWPVVPREWMALLVQLLEHLPEPANW